MENMYNEQLNFTTGLMREHRKIWSLQNDVDLLNNIETFSQFQPFVSPHIPHFLLKFWRIIVDNVLSTVDACNQYHHHLSIKKSKGLVKKTSFILDSMEEFNREIDVTSIGIKTLSNTFEGVSDTQFVENRVYDEDDMICEVDKNVDDSISLNLNKRLEDSLKQCTIRLESKFEAVSITMSDSEDENDFFNKGEVILIPKNRYKSRPLPHLIGGKDFYEDDSLGLLPPSTVSDTRGEQFFNGEDDVASIHNSDSSGTEEVDNSFQKNSLFTNIAKELQISNGSEQIESLAVNMNDNVQEVAYQDEKYLNDNFSKIQAESQRTNENSSSFHNISPEVHMNADITDEINVVYGEETCERQARRKLGNKYQNIIYGKEDPLKGIDDKHHRNDNFNNTQESHKILKSVFSDNIHSKTSMPTFTNEHKEDQISEENGLPKFQTEVLHSFGKNRAKIKGKRRLPTRRPRNVSNSSEAYIIKQGTGDNMLSPSTDEEDLFVLPNVSKELSSNSLFSAPSLFSPGTSIEGSSKLSFPSNVLKQKEIINTDRNEEHSEEPLKIKSNAFDSDKRTNDLFNDWDHFDTEESVLFSSVERKTRKTTLFENLTENSSSSAKSSKENKNDDIFIFPNNQASNSTSSLFSSSLSTAPGFTINNLSSPKPSKVFLDTDDGFSKNLFSSSDSDELFESFENNRSELNFSPEPVFGSKESGSKQVLNDKKHKSMLCSNPLMDTEDNIFE